ncbi:NmrA family NAD(P)-binding protein [Dokdonia sp.]|uniref:SDR family oxidoreductase n=1 Tax=Dokdonia sp. TaxID=2024995 RepID=UPI0032675CCF
MRIFVTGATGFQGATIAQQLLTEHHEVVTLKRNTSEGMPLIPGIKVVPGGLEDKESLATALQGTDAAVFMLPLIFDMDLAKRYTANFIEAAKAQHVPLVVFNTTFYLPTEETGLLALDMKVTMKHMLDTSGLNVITVVPDVYIDNLVAPWSIPVIINDHVLPYPVASGKKIPWISHVDLGKYVAAAIQKPELAGEVLYIGGNLYSGEEIAETIGTKIDAHIHFIGVAPNDFEQQLIPGFGALAAREISNLYRYVEQNHESFIGKDFAKSNELLSVTPQTLTEWVDSVRWSL